MSDWRLLYDGFNAEEEGLRESLCTLANGYFATRGAAPESRADGVHYPGTYAAGVFNRLATAVDGRVAANEYRFDGTPEQVCEQARRQALVDLVHAMSDPSAHDATTSA